MSSRARKRGKYAHRSKELWIKLCSMGQFFSFLLLHYLIFYFSLFSLFYFLHLQFFHFSLQLGKLRGGDQKIDQSGRSNALIWSCLQSLNKTPFLDDSAGKTSPYDHQVKDKI